jgi:hypothetical protein
VRIGFEGRKEGGTGRGGGRTEEGAEEEEVVLRMPPAKFLCRREGGREVGREGKREGGWIHR